MNKAFFIFLFFLLSITASSAQEVTILKGQILSDSLDGSSINIVNLTRKVGTTNNSKGEFEVAAAIGDSLFFSSVQYEPLEIVVTEEVLEKAVMKVYLTERVNELAEVTISNINLSGNLNNDLSTIPVFDQEAVGFQLRATPKLTSIQRKMSTAAGSPLLLVINSLNGRLRMLKKAQAIMEYENWIDVGLDILPPEFFAEELKIPIGKNRQFVYYCAEDPSFVALLKDGDALRIIENYLAKAALFNALQQNQNSEKDEKQQ